MRGGQKARSTAGAQLRRYPSRNSRAHSHAQGHVHSDWQTQSHIHARLYTDGAEKISLYFTGPGDNECLHFCSKGKSECRTFEPAGGVGIYLSMWQKIVYVYVRVGVWGTFYMDTTAWWNTRITFLPSPSKKASAELSVLSVVYSWKWQMTV